MLKRVGIRGCDDAPVVSIETAQDIQIVFPYYENRRTWQEQLRRFCNLPIRLQARITLIVVDDGSQDYPLADCDTFGWADPMFTLRRFRIKEDVRWNWIAARNLAMSQASDGWIAMTDMDHFFPEDTIYTMVYGKFDPRTIYRFTRTEDTKPIDPHPNSWFMTKDMFWKIGGYDEALSGYYGTDGDFRRRAAKTAPIEIMNANLERREFWGDSSTTRYERKQPEDRAVQSIVAARPKDWQPKTLTFPWEKIG